MAVTAIQVCGRVIGRHPCRADCYAATQKMLDGTTRAWPSRYHPRMAIRTLNVTGVTIGGYSFEATGRPRLTTIGDDRSWRATVGVLAAPELGVRSNLFAVSVETEQGETLHDTAHCALIDEPVAGGRVWLGFVGAGTYRLARQTAD